MNRAEDYFFQKYPNRSLQQVKRLKMFEIEKRVEAILRGFEQVKINFDSSHLYGINTFKKASYEGFQRNTN